MPSLAERRWAKRFAQGCAARRRESTGKSVLGACNPPPDGRYRAREVGGGRSTRQPGQVRKEAALTRTGRVTVQPPTLHDFERRRAPTRCGDADERPANAVPTNDPTTASAAPGLAVPRRAAGAERASLSRAGAQVPPATFDDLIGQEAMVRTLRNAFATGRIPQAWMLTGVRGVGKTTTARILARALNYERRTARCGPTIDMPSEGVHCRAIMESAPRRRAGDGRRLAHRRRRHARDHRRRALRAGLGALQGLHHRRSAHAVEAAFNALLKTLEEPPPHVKFIFATTEIRKVPVTVLSRCQRFDLRRVDAGAAGRSTSAGICAQGGRRGRAGGAGADRARRRGLGARRAVAARPGDRPWRRARSRAEDVRAHAGPRRPRPRSSICSRR